MCIFILHLHHNHDNIISKVSHAVNPMLIFELQYLMNSRHTYKSILH
nr:MAG TPA: hypothetical protein [Caudoviricetes sp.]